MFHIYRRVSSCEKRDIAEQTSLAEQERICRGIAQIRGAHPLNITIWTDGDVSGSIVLAERPDGSKMLADLIKGDVIIASKLDRMFRDAIDALEMAKKFRADGIDLILYDLGAESCLHGGMAKAFFGMAAIFADMERERINDRMRDGKVAKKQRGGHIGGEAPYGFKIVGSGKTARLHRVKEEQELLVLVGQLAVTMPADMVRRELKARGLTSRSGVPFQHVQVKRLIARSGVLDDQGRVGAASEGDLSVLRCGEDATQAS